MKNKEKPKVVLEYTEEEAHLADAVKFCAKQVLALFQYTQEDE